MPLGIIPTVDYAFKRLFGDPNHTDILLHLLNAVFEGQFVVDEVTILNPFLERDFEEDKLSILDIRARDVEGRQYNLEMQSNPTGAFSNRLMYYLASIYSEQLFSGEPYEQLAPAIGICFVGQVMFPGRSPFRTRFRLSSLEEGLEFSDHLELHLLELPKYRRGLGELSGASRMEKWICFMQRASELELSEIGPLFQEPAFVEAGGVLQMVSRTTEERLRYEARLKALRDLRSSIYEAKAEGRAEGVVEGRAVGLEQGREQGLEQGREQGQWIGKVQVLQEVLGDSVFSSSELATWELSRLQTFAQALQERLKESKP